MFLFLCIVALVVGSEAQQKCQSDAECGTNECCRAIVPLRGKREVTGFCSPSTRATQKCFVHEFSKSAVHYNACPCASGYHCKGSGFREMPQGEVGACELVQQKGKRQDPVKKQPCSSGKECADDECCVSRIRPLGKRAFFPSGQCTKMGTSGSHCLVNMKSTRPINQVFQCPCSSGFKCHGSGIFDIPLGETGVCRN